VFREDLFLPPYSRMAKLILGGLSEKEVMRQALELAKLLEIRSVGSAIHVAGPAPCLTSKQEGQFLWNIFLKGPSVEAVGFAIRAALKDFKRSRVTLSVDMDPQ
jgi:primosomal protein N' (replication factor Y)